HALLAGEVFDEVGAGRGEEGVGGEGAVGQAGGPLQCRLQQTVPLLVVLCLVGAAVADAFQGQRKVAVLEFEPQDGVEQGGQALWRRRVGPQRRRARFDGRSDRFDPRGEQGPDQPRPVAEGTEQGSLADAGRRRDVGHGDLGGVLAAGEEVIGGLDDGGPVPCRVLAGLAIVHATPRFAIRTGGPYYSSKRTTGPNRIGWSSTCPRTPPSPT